MGNLFDEEYRRSFVPAPREGGPQIRAGLTFGGAVENYFRSTYSNIADRLEFGPRPGGPYDESLDVYDALPERLRHLAPEFADARNKEDLNRMVFAYDAAVKRNMDMARTSGWKMFGAGTLDPINFLPIVGATGRAATSAARVGAYGAAVSTAQEAFSSEDMTRTGLERAINIGANTVFMGVLGAGASVPIAARKRVLDQLVSDMNAVDVVFQPVRGGSTTMPTQKFEAQLDPNAINELPEPSLQAPQTLPFQPTPTTSELPVSSFYINSKFDRFISTPYKRTLSPDVPADVQATMFDIGADHALISMANQSGQTRGASVFIESQRMNGEWIQAYRTIRNVWAQRRGGSTRIGEADLSDLGIRGRTLVQRALGQNRTTELSIDEFAEEMGRKYLAGIDGADDLERQAISEIGKFFQSWEPRLRESGLIGEPKFWRTRVDQLNWFLDQKLIPERQALVDSMKGLTGKSLTISKKDLTRLDRQIDAMRSKIRSFENQLQISKDVQVTPQKRDNFFPRFWRQDALRSDPKLRQGLEDTLTAWYQTQNRIIKRNKNGDFEVEIRSGKESDARKRARETVNEIINEDYQDVDNLTYGAGQSMNLRHRKIDIPNELVAEFIEVNPINVMKAYTQRVAPSYAFFKKFGGRSLDELEIDNTIKMKKAGLSDDRINEVNADIRTMYERVAGKVLRSPDRWDFKAYQGIQALMRMTYLGSTALLSLTETMRLVMDNGMPNTMRAVSGYYSNSRIKASAREAQIVGQALEGILGSAIMRFSDDLSSNPLTKNMLDKAQDGFFAMSGLNFVTRTLKELDVILRQHKFIEDALKDASGKLPQKSMEVLRKHGLSAEDSKAIAQLVRDGVIEKDPKTGFFLANTEAWPAGAVRDNFRNSLSIGMMNTILMASPADKPRIVDGVVLIPNRIASQFGFKPDKNYTGYSRIESPFFAAPFGLMSYTLAATNKALGSASQGQHKHLLAGVLFGIGASWMLLDYKTPDFVWDEMPLQDKLTRAFDITGMGGIWMDLVYRSLSMGEATGLGNPSGGILSPRFPPDAGPMSVAQEIMGPSSSYAFDTASAITDLVSGNLSEGASNLVKQMPGSTLFYWRGLVNEWRRGLEEVLPEQVGFGRF